MKAFVEENTWLRWVAPTLRLGELDKIYKRVYSGNMLIILSIEATYGSYGVMCSPVVEVGPKLPSTSVNTLDKLSVASVIREISLSLDPH